MILSQGNALTKFYVQPNGPAHIWRMVIDVDREYAAASWIDETAEPNWIARNRDNGHAHLSWEYTEPLIRSDAGRLKPLRYAAAIEGAYTHRLGGDHGYSGLICKNPLQYKHWDVIAGAEKPYTLDQLAEYVPNISQWKRPSRQINTQLGRNCQMFEWLRQWAYRNINNRVWISYRAWFEVIELQCRQLNDFSQSSFSKKYPLPESEIRAISKSVARWVWRELRGSQEDYVARTHSSEIQAARGRRSGQVRRKNSSIRKALEAEI